MKGKFYNQYLAFTVSIGATLGTDSIQIPQKSANLRRVTHFQSEGAVLSTTKPAALKRGMLLSCRDLQLSSF